MSIIERTSNLLANSLMADRRALAAQCRRERRPHTFVEISALGDRLVTVETERGPVEIRASVAGNSRRLHSRVTYKLNGQRIGKELLLKTLGEK